MGEGGVLSLRPCSGMLIAGMMGSTGAISGKGANRVSALLFTGILLFSGSLYMLALSGSDISAR